MSDKKTRDEWREALLRGASTQPGDGIIDLFDTCDKLEAERDDLKAQLATRQELEAARDAVIAAAKKLRVRYVECMAEYVGWDEDEYAKVDLKEIDKALANLKALGSKNEEPRLAREQSCGCLVCQCEDQEQCQGCGAKNCETHPAGYIPNPVWESKNEGGKGGNPNCRNRREL